MSSIASTSASTTGRRNRAKNAHLPTLRRKRIIKRSTFARHLKRLDLIHDQVANLHFFPPRHIVIRRPGASFRGDHRVARDRRPGHCRAAPWESARDSAKGKAPRLRTAAGRQVQSAVRLIVAVTDGGWFERSRQAASLRDGRISTSAEMPGLSCKRRIMPIDRLRLRFSTSAMRERLGRDVAKHL
jgi:hypothetical protein